MLKSIMKGLGGTAAAAAATLTTAQMPPPQGGPGAPPPGRGQTPPPGGGLSRYLPTQQQWDSNAKTQQWVAKAREVAGTDPDLVFDFNVFCKPSGGSNGSDRASIGVPDSEPRLQPYPAPAKAVPLGGQRLFDNFYWFGDTGVGAWLVTTPDGYILFDALNTADEARDVLVPAMRKFGLDPAKIKYMVFGHFHFDHTGGGHYIESIAHPKIIMGRDDWPLYFQTMEHPTGPAAANSDKVAMTKGIEATDGMKITLGGTTATIYQMTGHTPGSIGMIVPVKYQGKDHPILLVTAATDVHNREAFVGGYEHIWDEGIKAHVESVMQVHPNTNMNLLARTTYIDKNYPPAKNPLLYGAARTERYINIMRYCTLGRMDALGW